MTAPTGPDRTGVVARLDALEAAWKAATPGPWKVGLRAGTGTGYYTDDGCPLGSAGLRADAAAIVAEHNTFPDLLAAVRGVLDKHKPFYEYKGVRQEHTVNVPCADYDQCDGDWDRECDGSEDGVHEVAACAECQWTDGDLYGYATWPCPTVRDLAAALGEA